MVEAEKQVAKFRMISIGAQFVSVTQIPNMVANPLSIELSPIKVPIEQIHRLEHQRMIFIDLSISQSSNPSFDQ